MAFYAFSLWPGKYNDNAFSFSIRSRDHNLSIYCLLMMESWECEFSRGELVSTSFFLDSLMRTDRGNDSRTTAYLIGSELISYMTKTSQTSLLFVSLRITVFLCVTQTPFVTMHHTRTNLGFWRVDLHLQGFMISLNFKVID